MAAAAAASTGGRAAVRGRAPTVRLEEMLWQKIRCVSMNQWGRGRRGGRPSTSKVGLYAPSNNIFGTSFVIVLIASLEMPICFRAGIALRTTNSMPSGFMAMRAGLDAVG